MIETDNLPETTLSSIEKPLDQTSPSGALFTAPNFAYTTVSSVAQYFALQCAAEVRVTLITVLKFKDGDFSDRSENAKVWK